MIYLTSFGGKTLVNKLWPLLYKKAELDLRLTKSFITRFLKQKFFHLLIKVLMEYRGTISQLEKVILKTGDARLSHLQHKIVSNDSDPF